MNEQMFLFCVKKGTEGMGCYVMDYREEIKKLIDKTQNQEKLKIIYRIVKRYLGLE